MSRNKFSPFRSKMIEFIISRPLLGVNHQTTGKRKLLAIRA